MELEVAGLTGAAYGEKNPERLVQRLTGTRPRRPAVELRICARGSYFSAFLEPRRMAENWHLRPPPAGALHVGRVDPQTSSPSIGRLRKAFTLSSISWHSRLTWLLEMPLIPNDRGR
jgi:hypothetical protein